MSPEYEKLLTDKYPKILVEGAGFMGHGCELSVGDGWYFLLDELCGKLQAESDASGVQIKATQIKEKFGGLRFYADYANEKQNALIDEYALRINATCENCGTPGKPRPGGWIKTLCDECTANDPTK